MDKYRVIIYWSEEDGAFIAEIPELPGCMAHGPDHEAALRNVRDAMSLGINTAQEFGHPFPPAKGRHQRRD